MVDLFITFAKVYCFICFIIIYHKMFDEHLFVEHLQPSKIAICFDFFLRHGLGFGKSESPKKITDSDSVVSLISHTQMCLQSLYCLNRVDDLRRICL